MRASSNDLPESTLAELPKDLNDALKALLAKDNNQGFALGEHYILYQIGNLNSLIKIDMSECPFLVWHYNLQGRAVFPNVKETILNTLSGLKENEISKLFNISTVSKYLR